MITHSGKRSFVFDYSLAIVLCVLCAIMIYPVLYVLGRSFMTELDRSAYPFAVFPRSIDLTGYAYIFQSGSYILNSYGITILRAAVGTICNLFVTATLAYTMAKKRYPLRGPITALAIVTMWFHGGMIPDFLLIKSLGLMNSFWVMILPRLVTTWYLLILRNFFATIPDSLEESATIDGANDFQIAFQIVMPLSIASISTIGLFYAVDHWNAWFDALIYISEPSLWPIQVFLRELIRNANLSDIVDQTATITSKPPSDSVTYATIVVSTVPILCIYPFIQKYFVQGVLVGSLKG